MRIFFDRASRRQQIEVDSHLSPPSRDDETNRVHGADAPPARDPHRWKVRVDLRVVAALVALVVLWALFPKNDSADRRGADATDSRVYVADASLAEHGGIALGLERIRRQGNTLAILVSRVEGMDPKHVVSIRARIGMRGEDNDVNVWMSAVTDGRGLAFEADEFRDDGEIVGVSISALELDVPIRQRWNVDLASLWPVDRGRVRAATIDERRQVGGISLTLESLIAFGGQLQAVFDRPNEEIQLGRVQLDLPLGQIDAAEIVERSGEFVAFFSPPPGRLTEAGIVVLSVTRWVAGPFSWRVHRDRT